MNPIDYKAFYEQVGKTNGWDFSRVKCITEGLQPDFYTEVKKNCRTSDLLLDLGTGGGEAVLTIANALLLLVGIDQSAAMVETAIRNGARAGISNARFFQMEAAQLNFPESFFNVVSCRHSEFYPEEMAKVLTKGGIFLTQQVSEDDKLNLKEAFGRGQAFGAKAGTLKENYITELCNAGFSDIQAYEFHITEYYQTAEDLIFLLKHTPIIPGFGHDEADFQTLQHFIKENQTDKGIQTSSSRFMLTAKR